MENGKTYLRCEGTFGQNRIQAKIQVEFKAEDSILVKAHINQIDSQGEITNLGNPSMQMPYNETAEISQLVRDQETLSLAVTPRVR